MNKRLNWLATAMCVAFLCVAAPASADLEVGGHSQALQGIPHTLEISGLGGGATAQVRVLRGDDVLFEGEAESDDGEATVEVAIEELGAQALRVEVGDEHAEADVYVHRPWLSLLPAILAILMALIFRHVVLALFAGVAIGSVFVAGYNPLTGILRSVDHYAVDAVADPDHASVLVFSLALGGMIAVMTASGGARGLAEKVTTRATTARRGQVSTWLLGIVIFFDDYANSLLVGSSMRPITDRLRISREKLAFLVDATAAPVSSIALVSSWIGVEVGYIREQLVARDIEMDPYLAFLQTLPYRFYPWLMLVFGLALVLMNRDFGPMYKAERRARSTGKVLADDAKPASRFDAQLPDAPPRFWLAIAPIITVVGVALLGMYFTGRAVVVEEGKPLLLGTIFGNANSLNALLWAACAGGVVAVAGALMSGALKLGPAIESWMEGLKSMLVACVILVLAWSLGSVCKDLHTADFVIQAIGEGLSPSLLPAIVFIVAAAVSFATGTSWGTMAILFPLVVPLADGLAPGEMHILLGAMSSILAGSVFGDHCSPISDTTIMSSMATSCDHIDHVRTQLPYALVVGLIAIVLGELGTGYGLYPAWVGLLLGAIAVILVVRFVGKPVDLPGDGSELVSAQGAEE